jgi:hypothetical protein
VDAAGNLVITDGRDCRVRVVADTTGTFYGIAMQAGFIYTVAGDGNCTFSGPGGPATGAGIDPYGVAVDAAGNLVIAVNDRVMAVAESTGTFYGQPMTAGDIYTVAGDGSSEWTGGGIPAVDAGMSPGTVAVDSDGNLLIGDLINHRVLVVADRTGTFYGQPMTSGDVYSLAGNGSHTSSGDGGPATNAGFVNILAVTVDHSGNVIIADFTAGRVRVVAHSTGTFYGVAMTAGDIYTVAGNGKDGFSGDGGPATKTAVGGPDGLAVNSAGNLLVTAGYEHRVRMVEGG